MYLRESVEAFRRIALQPAQGCVKVPQREHGVISQNDLSRQRDMYSQENKGPHNRLPIKPPAQSEQQYNEAKCPASKVDPLEIIDRDDRRPGYDPDKDEYFVTPSY